MIDSVGCHPQQNGRHERVHVAFQKDDQAAPNLRVKKGSIFEKRSRTWEMRSELSLVLAWALRMGFVMWIWFVAGG